jgi:hypothetical protein
MTPASLESLLSVNPMHELHAVLAQQREILAPSKTSQMGQFIARKSNWVPASYQDILVHPTPTNTHKAILKSLALALALEIPVGEYTLAASQKEFKTDQCWALLDNAADEVTHFTALRNLAQALDLQSQALLAEYSKVAQQFAGLIERIPEHTIVKSGYIEMGVFLVVLSLMRKFGTPQMKILVGDISRDESVHVQTNWAIIDSQDIPYTDSKLDPIRRAIVSWVTEDILARRWARSFWLEQSDRLIETRRADGLQFTAAPTTVAFFEVSNSTLADY